MRVYVLFKDLYEGREVEGVYTSLEAAQAQVPGVQWKSVKRYAYEDGPPWWRSKDATEDCHIEEHEMEIALHP